MAHRADISAQLPQALQPESTHNRVMAFRRSLPKSDVKSASFSVRHAIRSDVMAVTVAGGASRTANGVEALSFARHNSLTLKPVRFDIRTPEGCDLSMPATYGQAAYSAAVLSANTERTQGRAWAVAFSRSVTGSPSGCPSSVSLITLSSDSTKTARRFFERDAKWAATSMPRATSSGVGGGSFCDIRACYGAAMRGFNAARVVIEDPWAPRGVKISQNVCGNTHFAEPARALSQNAGSLSGSMIACATSSQSPRATASRTASIVDSVASSSGSRVGRSGRFPKGRPLALRPCGHSPKTGPGATASAADAGAVLSGRSLSMAVSPHCLAHKVRHAVAPVTLQRTGVCNAQLSLHGAAA